MAAEGTNLVDASFQASAVVGLTFVNVYARSVVSVQLVALWTLAAMPSLGIDTVFFAFVGSFSTLIDIDAFCSVRAVAVFACAIVSVLSVDADVCATSVVVFAGVMVRGRSQ